MPVGTFRAGEGPNRDIFCDCNNSGDGSFAAVYNILIQAGSVGGVGGRAGLGMAPSRRHNGVIFTGRQSHGYIV